MRELSAGRSQRTGLRPHWVHLFYQDTKSLGHLTFHSEWIIGVEFREVISSQEVLFELRDVE
jgi:hypothetical protein